MNQVPVMKMASARSLRRSALGKATAVALTATAVLGSGPLISSADAATVRQGARWNQIDVLLDRSETQNIARSPGVDLARICGPVAAAAAVAGPYGVAAAGAVCTTAVTVCAARANVRGRRAGMTIPLPNAWSYWCWDY